MFFPRDAGQYVEKVLYFCIDTMCVIVCVCVCMYVYVYVCVCMCVCMYTCVNTCVYECVCPYVYVLYLYTNIKVPNLEC